MPPTAARSAGVKSALRVLEIFEYFAQAMVPATLARLSAELDLPKSSCHALMETLQRSGYVYWLGKDVGYYPTRRWHDLGSAIMRHDPILLLVSATLREISQQTGETAIIAKRQDHEVLYLDVVEPDRTLRFTAYAGQAKPLHSSASGRALLQLLDEDARAAIISRLTLRKFSPYTITEAERLRTAIREGGKTGYHVAIGEYQSDTTAIAVGLRFGTEEYALVVGGPTHRVEAHIDEIGTMLMARAREVEALRGGGQVL